MLTHLWIDGCLLYGWVAGETLLSSFQAYMDTLQTQWSWILQINQMH